MLTNQTYLITYVMSSQNHMMLFWGTKEEVLKNVQAVLLNTMKVDGNQEVSSSKKHNNTIKSQKMSIRLIFSLWNLSILFKLCTENLAGLIWTSFTSIVWKRAAWTLCITVYFGENVVQFKKHEDEWILIFLWTIFKYLPPGWRTKY